MTRARPRCTNRSDAFQANHSWSQSRQVSQSFRQSLDKATSARISRDERFHATAATSSTAMNKQQFIGRLVIRVLPHWELCEGECSKFELHEPFEFVSKEFGRICVPIGFVTDLGSVPTAAKPIVDNDDPDLVFAAIAHDYLYKNRGEIRCNSIMPPRVLTRYECDCVLYEAMIAAGAPKLKAWLVFRAVRIGGGSAWRS